MTISANNGLKLIKYSFGLPTVVLAKGTHETSDRLKTVKILFLSPGGTLGGAERSLLNLFSELPKEIPDVKFHLVQQTEGPLAEEAAKLGATITILPLPEALRSLGDSALNDSGLLPLLMTK